MAKKNISSLYHLLTYLFPYFQIYSFFYIRRISKDNHALDNYSLEYVYVHGKIGSLRVEDIWRVQLLSNDIQLIEFIEGLWCTRHACFLEKKIRGKPFESKFSACLACPLTITERKLPTVITGQFLISWRSVTGLHLTVKHKNYRPSFDISSPVFLLRSKLSFTFPLLVDSMD